MSPASSPFSLGVAAGRGGGGWQHPGDEVSLVWERLGKARNFFCLDLSEEQHLGTGVS